MSQIQKTVQTAEEIKVAWANWCKNVKEQKAAKNKQILHLPKILSIRK